MKARFVNLLVVFLLVATFVPHNVISVKAASNDRIPVRGVDYLDGHGVDVKYHPTDNPPYSYDKYGQCTYGGCYQCVELVVRLYAQVLGYDRWKSGDPESKHRWPINPYTGQIMTPADMVGVVQYADTVKSTDSNYNDYKIFKDLEYYRNGSTTPPRPGDILIYNNKGTGDHTGIISRVGGNKLEIVEQNWLLAGKRTLKLTYNQGSYTIESSMGWIHSPRMDSLLTISKMNTVSERSYFGEFKWNRDRDTVYVYLSPKATEILGNDSSGQRQGAGSLTFLLSIAGALRLTEFGYTQCIATQITDLIQNRFKLSATKSLDFTIKYTGQSIWVRAWWKSGPSSNSGWIQVDGIRCSWDGSRY